MLLFMIVAALIAVVSAAGEQQVKCPVLSCVNSGMNSSEECYAHDGKDPVETINL